MPIEPRLLAALLDHLDVQLATTACDDSSGVARRWLEERGVPVNPTLFALLALGGGCDCEIVLNVEPESIYPKQ